MMAREKAPISERALIQRINRVLKKDGRRLKATRGNRWRSNLGDYYVVNTARNWIDWPDVNIESLGHELSCLKAWEQVGEGK
jgi:hypothetical protein